MFIYFILALLPVIWLIFSLCILKMQAWLSSLLAMLIAAIEAIFIFKLSVFYTFTAALEGFAMAIWPIVLVIIAAVFTYNITVKSKAMDKIKVLLASISNDKRIMVLLIGWCFGGFMEAMAGFGTAIAIPASMLAGVGFDPIEAILVCLIANGCPTMFGSIGIPTITLASVTGLDSTLLAYNQAIMTAPLLFISPFLMVMLVSKGFKGLKPVLPLVTLASLSFVLPEIVVAKYAGADLTIIVAAVCSLICTVIGALYYSKHHLPDKEFAIETDNNIRLDVKEILRAFAPFIIIFVVLLASSKLVPFINKPLSAIKTTMNIYKGDPEALITFSWVNTPGVLILVSGTIGGLIQKLSFKEILNVLKATINQMSKTILTMLGVLGCAKIMGYSGMIGSIADFFVSTFKGFYPLFAPLIGALGTFVTGSGTSSQVLFGNVQLQAALAINKNPIWLVAANSLGTASGKMLSPQSIAIGCAACNLQGKDGEILSKIFKYVIFYIIVSALIVYFGLNFVK